MVSNLTWKETSDRETMSSYDDIETDVLKFSFIVTTFFSMAIIFRDSIQLLQTDMTCGTNVLTLLESSKAFDKDIWEFYFASLRNDAFCRHELYASAFCCDLR